MIKMNSAVIVVPTYNEKNNLQKFVDSVNKQNLNLDILFVDDNSPDGTGILAEELTKKYPNIKVLHRANKEGLGRAYKAGFKWALNNHYKIIMQMDADLSHDPAALHQFMREIPHYDAIFGSRYLNGIRVYNWSFKRLLLSKCSNDFIRLMLGINTTDTTTAFKCFKREVLEAIDLDSLQGRQNAFLIELVYRTIRKDFKTKEIPFLFMERETGESKMEFKVAIESLFTVLRLMIIR